MSRRTRRTFTAEFKEQIVKLYHTGKKVSYLSIEYDLSEQQIYHWIRQYNNSQSFKEADNRTEEERNSFVYAKKSNNYEWKMIF